MDIREIDLATVTIWLTSNDIIEDFRTLSLLDTLRLTEIQTVKSNINFNVQNTGGIQLNVPLKLYTKLLLLKSNNNENK